MEGYYRCTLGLFGSFEEAHQLRKALQNDGFKSAFVVPYIFGVRIEKKDARRYSDKFPDLANYIRG